MGRIKLHGAEIGKWYRDREGRLFEVVAMDGADATIEIQHYDGTLEELDSHGWMELLPQVAEPPEDWSGPIDVSEDDYLAEFGEDTETDWKDPLDHLDRLG